MGVEDLPRAVQQYEYVLGIEPLNIDALYRMGLAQQRNGNWFQAQAFYSQVVALDPFYENALRQYNLLARQHADRIDLSATAFADPSTARFGVQTLIGLPLSAAAELQLQFRAESLQLNTVFGGTAMQTNHVSVSLPITVIGTGLSLTPLIGGSLIYNSLWSQTPPPEPRAPAFLPQDLRVFPAAGADVSLAFGSVGSGRLSYRWRVNEETLEPLAADADYLDHTWQAEIALFPGFIPVSELGGLSTRTFGELRAITTPAWLNLEAPPVQPVESNIWTVVQDLSWRLFEVGNPAHTLTALGTVLYRDTETALTPVDYFAPDSELTLTGGLSYSVWANLDGGDALSGALRMTGGAAQSGVGSATPGDWVPQIGGELFLSHQRSGARYFLAASGSATFPDIDPDVNVVERALDYWSLTITAGFAGRAPRFLEP